MYGLLNQEAICTLCMAEFNYYWTWASIFF